MPFIVEDKANDCPLEPVAICGMACRLPGQVDSASKLWELLTEKGSVQTPKVPSNRFNIDAHFHKNLERPGSFNVLGGYFLDGNLEDFDPTFFKMTPVEAMWLDPQQRKMLEVSYECLESAGLSMEAVAGSNTAVFVGCFTADYQQMSTKDSDFRHNYAATGVDPGLISNRIGNVFNLNGPSFTINTACSSSIYAIHNACHALRTRDCDAAIAGGVNLILTVDQHMNTAKLGILSPTSTCHTFDASADGYGRAEGAGALYLKRLDDAIRDGDPVRAVIRTSAVNTNGKVAGMGITHPSVKGQERVVRQAYKRANLNPDETAYLECHGTGTPVGDPIEVRAVSSAMNDTRNSKNPLLLGAIKANIGHSEAASGIFAVMKAALMTENAQVPGVSGLKNLNPAIHEDKWNVQINRDTRPWPADFPARRASVSSFGYGGTNGHVVVESIDSLHSFYQHGQMKQTSFCEKTTPRPFLVVMSAHDMRTLERNIEAHAAIAPKYHLHDLAYTLNTRRTRFDTRGFGVVYEGEQQKAFALDAFKFGSVSTGNEQLGFIFTGQGAQWVGMAVEALNAFPSFLATIRSLDRVLHRVANPPWSLEQVLLTPANSSRISEAEIAQPICSAVQIAIVDLFEEWGISPAVTVGHSSGEIAAAYAAGLLSAPEAILAAFYRGLAVKEAAPAGAMLAVGLGASEIPQYLSELEAVVGIACENSPNSVTLSGTFDGIQAVKSRLENAKIFARELRTGKAYHSSQMSAVASIYNDLLSTAYAKLTETDLDWSFQRRSRWFSSVSGSEFLESSVPNQYWSENLRSRVLFDSAVRSIGNTAELEGPVSFVEIGPHSALAGPFRQICTANAFQQFTYVPTLCRGQDSASQLLKCVGELVLKGHDIDLVQVNSLEMLAHNSTLSKPRVPQLLVDLPPYQWNYERSYWVEPRFSDEQRHLTHPRHDLLGSKVTGLSEHCFVWRNVLRHKDVPWLKDHSLGGSAVFPAAGHMSLAIEALRQNNEINGLSTSKVTLRDIDISTALVIPDNDNGVEIQFRFQRLMVAEKPSETWYSFAVESISESQWTVHSQGLIASSTKYNPRSREMPYQVSNLTQRVSGKRWYDAFHKVGFDYQRSFQPLKSIRSNGKDTAAFADLQITQESGLMSGESRYMLHPATIDACLQLIIISINRGLHKDIPWGVVPVRLEEVNIWMDDRTVDCPGNAVAWTDERDGRYFNTHTVLQTDTGKTVLDVKNLRCIAYEAAVPQQQSESRDPEPYMDLAWMPDVELDTASGGRILQHAGSYSESLARLVESLVHKKPIKSLLVLGNYPSSEIDALNGVIPPKTMLKFGSISEANHEKLESANIHERFSAVFLAGNPQQWKDSITEPAELVIVQPGLFSPTIHEVVRSLTTEQGRAVFLDEAMKDSSSSSEHTNEGFVSAGSYLYKLVNYGTQVGSGATKGEEELTILGLSDATPSLQDLASRCRSKGSKVQVKSFLDIDIAASKRIIIDDSGGTLLSTLNEATYKALKMVLCAEKPIVWLTRGAFEGKTVAAAMAQGFLRALRSEQPAARITYVDVDLTETTETIAKSALKLLDEASTKDSGADNEFWLHQSSLHIGRLVPNVSLNAPFTNKNESSTTLLPSRAFYSAQINDGRLTFSETSTAEQSFAPSEVELQVFATDFHKSDLHTSSERLRVVAGEIVRVANAEDAALVGRAAVAYSREAFSTMVRIPKSAYAVVADVDAATLVASLPSLCSVVNAIVQSGKVSAGDRVLILPAPQTFVHSVVALSKVLGFDVSLVVANEGSHESLLEDVAKSPKLLSDADLPSIQAWLSCRESAPIVIANEFSYLSQEVWRSMPATGCFILNDAAVTAPPDALPFTRGASFLSTGVNALFRKSPTATGELLDLTAAMIAEHRDSLIQTPKTLDVGLLHDIPEEVQIDEIGVVTYSYGRSEIQIQKSHRKWQFSPEAAYIFVGCLGGLGRSLISWALSKGCRKFVFLSRSGADKPEATTIIKMITSEGASADVYRGDASVADTVQSTVNEVSSKHPIKGVVHAAMVLQDTMFESLSYNQFMAAVQPKMLGAINLHNALKDTALDFFVMTSSISAVLGNPGQANYCAGNSFLDSLAWHRKKNGLAASSLALPMVLDVGVVAENDHIETSLSRKGMYGIDEREMLTGFESAILASAPCADESRERGNSLLMMGLDPPALAAAIDSQESPDVYWENDARLALIRDTVEEIRNSSSSGGNSQGDFAASLKAVVPDGLAAVLQLVATHIMKKCASILLVPADSFAFEGKSVASYGLDSMIGAELRNWLFKEFGVTLAFQDLLSPTLAFKNLSEIVAEKLGVS